VPYAEFCSEEEAHIYWRGLCAADMTANLSGNKNARNFLEGDVLGSLADRGIDVVELCHGRKT
jgi:hypothetical protein